jgi:hypothetical protein
MSFSGGGGSGGGGGGFNTVFNINRNENIDYTHQYNKSVNEPWITWNSGYKKQNADYVTNKEIKSSVSMYDAESMLRM